MNVTKKIHCEPGYDCRAFMTGDWLDEDSRHVMHERYYCRRIPANNRQASTPAQIAWLVFDEPITRYWVSDYVYKVKTLADYEAKKYGFFAEKEPYCSDEDPGWFPSFTDFDKALEFLKDKIGITYVPE